MATKVKDIKTNDWQISATAYGKVVTDDDDIRQSIFLILYTRKGADPMRPLFGCSYTDFIDQPVNIAVPNMVNEISKSIKLFEKRVTLASISARVEEAQIFFDLKVARLTDGHVIGFTFPAIEVPTIALPGITGTLSVCMGINATLYNAMPGGVWSSGNTSVATINATTGVVTSVSAGTSLITYTVGGRFTQRIFTVNAMPVLSAITGTLSVEVGSATTLANSTPGGSWSSSDITIATVDPVTGVVTGVSIGSATITYAVVNPTGCGTSVSASISVNAVFSSYDIVLYPKMQVIALPATASIPPSTLGKWQFQLIADAGFINQYPLYSAYDTSNNIKAQVMIDAQAGVTSTIRTYSPVGSYPPSSKLIEYHVPKLWFGSSGFGADCLVWFDVPVSPVALNTVHFQSTGSIAVYNAQISPLIVLSSATQTPKGYGIAEILITYLGTTLGNANFRLTRSHPNFTGALPGHTIAMHWVGDAATGTADPADPSNPDKTIISAPAGIAQIINIGVRSEYTDNLFGTTYHRSIYNAVIKIN